MYYQIVPNFTPNMLLLITLQYFASGYNQFDNLGISNLNVTYVQQFMKNSLRFQQISQGSEGTLFLNKSRLYGIGRSDLYQLGTSTEVVMTSLTEIDYFKTMEITDIAVGKMHSLILTKDQKLFSSGNNYHGQLGRQSDRSQFGGNPPQEVDLKFLNGEKIQKIGILYNDLSVVQTKSKVFLAGYCAYGMCGNVFGDQPDYFELKLPSNTTFIQQLTLGIYNLYLKDQNNQSWAIGYDFNGQLCQGSEKVDRREWVKLPSGIVQISAKSHFQTLYQIKDDLYFCGKSLTFNSSNVLKKIQKPKGKLIDFAAIQEAQLVLMSEGLFTIGQSVNGSTGNENKLETEWKKIFDAQPSIASIQTTSTTSNNISTFVYQKCAERFVFKNDICQLEKPMWDGARITSLIVFSVAIALLGLMGIWLCLKTDICTKEVKVLQQKEPLLKAQ